MQEHNKIQLYVGLEEGGCVDVGAIKLAGFTLIETNALQDLKEERDALEAVLVDIRRAWNRCGGWPDNAAEMERLRVAIEGKGV